MEGLLHTGSRLPILIMQEAVGQTARQGRLVEKANSLPVCFPSGWIGTYRMARSTSTQND